MACHIAVELRILLRPKARKTTCGEAFISASTMPLYSPAGDMAGARATKTSTFWLSVGWTESAANAWAVPCENPIYDKDGCLVTSRIYSMLSGIS